jgi:N-acetylglucosamine-6-phosphate deacetylase
MILLAGADIVLPDRLISRGSLLIDGERIIAIESRVVDTLQGAERLDMAGSTIAPGFVDVHVHGVEGHDVLDGHGAVGQVAARLPRYGVTAFCPTSVACAPATLQQMLQEIRTLAGDLPEGSARVLPAHLESNFINVDYKGAQPLACLRSPRVEGAKSAGDRTTRKAHADGVDFSSDEILATIASHREQVGIVTLAPELEGGIELVRQLVAAGHTVSIGHSGASYEETRAAIDAGVRHATHLFNRMSAMTHRAPGIPGAVLESAQVRAELICDGFHVHPAVMTLAIRAKGPGGIMAITDSTAGSGLPAGSHTRLGGQTILVTRRAAELADGTLAGSILTMDVAFRGLLQRNGVALVDAARLCATTPADQVGLSGSGRIAVGATADLVILDAACQVVSTYVRGRPWRNPDEVPHV